VAEACGVPLWTRSCSAETMGTIVGAVKTKNAGWYIWQNKHRTQQRGPHELNRWHPLRRYLVNRSASCRAWLMPRKHERILALRRQPVRGTEAGRVLKFRHYWFGQATAEMTAKYNSPLEPASRGLLALGRSSKSGIRPARFDLNLSWLGGAVRDRDEPVHPRNSCSTRTSTSRDRCFHLQGIEPNSPRSIFR
jgi:hypothetical protein